MIIYDKKKLTAKITRAKDMLVRDGEDNLFLFQRARDGLIDHLRPIKQNLKTIFCHNILLPLYSLENTLTESWQGDITERQDFAGEKESYQATIDFFGLNYVGDLSLLLSQHYQLLLAQGFFNAVLLAGEGLALLEQSVVRAEMLSGRNEARFFPHHTVGQLTSALQKNNFQEIIIDNDRLEIRYDDRKKLLHDMRAMAMTNSLNSLPPHFHSPDKGKAILSAWDEFIDFPLILHLELIYIHAIKGGDNER